MKNPSLWLPSTRREFLRSGTSALGLLAFSRFAPSFLVESALGNTPAPEKDRRVLVLVQLAGGNDGLNTLIPYEDDNYFRLRPTLAIPKESVLKLNDSLGLNPAAQALYQLTQSGTVGIVQNVGYPNPNRSHFRSTEIWETASESDTFAQTGWIGRYLDNHCSGIAPSGMTDPDAIHFSDELPQSFTSEQSHPTFGLIPNRQSRKENRESLALLEKLSRESPSLSEPGNASFLQQTTLDALVTEKRVQDLLGRYQTDSAYPTSSLAQSLKNVAALIGSGMSTRVYFVSLTGFDTHSNQHTQHAQLLKTLGDALMAFQKDLQSKKLDQQVLTMTFSEFGRRPNENQSRGTDHGTAAPLFVMGSNLKGTLFGTAPSLELEKNQDLTFSTDFRQVYSTLLDRWLECDAKAVLGKTFAPLGLV